MQQIKFKFTYWVKAFAPDPSGEDRYFTYDGKVGRNEPLNSNVEFDWLLEGLSDHVLKEKNIYCAPKNFAIQKIELIDNE